MLLFSCCRCSLSNSPSCSCSCFENRLDPSTDCDSLIVSCSCPCFVFLLLSLVAVSCSCSCLVFLLLFLVLVSRIGLDSRAWQRFDGNSDIHAFLANSLQFLWQSHIDDLQSLVHTLALLLCCALLYSGGDDAQWASEANNCGMPSSKPPARRFATSLWVLGFESHSWIFQDKEQRQEDGGRQKKKKLY